MATSITKNGYSVITFAERYTDNKAMEEDPATCIPGIAKDSVKGEMFQKKTPNRHQVAKCCLLVKLFSIYK